MTQDTFAAFQGVQLLRRGALDSVLAAVKDAAAAGMAEPGILIFDESSGRQVDFDLRGTLAEIVERANAQLAAKPAGRPRLGVSSREVTLLPRHWHWLEKQRGGASAAPSQARGRRDPGGCSYAAFRGPNLLADVRARRGPAGFRRSRAHALCRKARCAS